MTTDSTKAMTLEQRTIKQINEWADKKMDRLNDKNVAWIAKLIADTYCRPIDLAMVELADAIDAHIAPREVSDEAKADLVSCDWQEGALFYVTDDPDEHKPCYLVMPDGACLILNHHATNGVDQARAQFIADCCNQVLCPIQQPADSLLEVSDEDAYRACKVGRITRDEPSKGEIARMKCILQADRQRGES